MRSTHGSPEKALRELETPERMAEIEADQKKAMQKAKKCPPNRPLSEILREENDDREILADEDDDRDPDERACLICDL